MPLRLRPGEALLERLLFSLKGIGGAALRIGQCHEHMSDGGCPGRSAYVGKDGSFGAQDSNVRGHGGHQCLANAMERFECQHSAQLAQQSVASVWAGH